VYESQLHVCDLFAIFEVMTLSDTQVEYFRGTFVQPYFLIIVIINFKQLAPEPLGKLNSLDIGRKRNSCWLKLADITVTHFLLVSLRPGSLLANIAWSYGVNHLVYSWQ